MARLASVPSDALDALIVLCGADNVLTGEEERRFFSQDVHASGKTPFAIVRPTSRESAAQAVSCATSHGLAVFPRGGGMSYTDSYLPTRSASIILDTSKLDRVLSIDARALTATVEAGCTWAKLDAMLAPYSVRACFWGPFSGHDATVGGSLSQGTATFGSGIAGTSGDNVLSVEVALADGSIVRTGMDAQAGHPPFFRQYGPDLTGIFANDAGALGIKLSVTLPLCPRSAHVDGVSMVFADFAALSQAMEAVAREGLATEVFAMDPVVTAQFSGEPDLGRDLAILRQIGRGRGGIRRVARTVTGGRSFLKRPGFHAHFVTEGRDSRDLRNKLGAIRMLTESGAEIPNTVPSAIRAMPFSPLPVTDPKGRRVLPIHGIVRYAEAGALHARIMEIIAGHAELAANARLVIATSFFAVGRNALLYEPVFYWEDELSPFQLSKTVSTERYAPNPDARALVETMREAMVGAMFDHGAAHLQIGKRYPYLRERDASLLRTIKQALDPRNLINPGALGL